ncbi:cupin domain-containing protein [Spongiivirga citrea]|uniref:Cupin domain-containing protein n=1 Tax=Spongiivirga citrea TaxID=1481457 RepID=A0A6M0CQ84_9FLAO|nr:cupin domain-containing protein [Spongiivirga citrea]NER18039.1 cupin domain-containing protein [Spongiivirga citrea]
MKPINIQKKHAEFTKQWHPHQVAVVDDMQVLLAKIQGEFVWHAHENEDELFQVVKGTLYMQFRDRTEVVNEGEFIVVPKGVEHNPSTKPDEEVQLLLFEKLTTAHTGDVQHEMTKTSYPKI